MIKYSKIYMSEVYVIMFNITTTIITYIILNNSTFSKQKYSHRSTFQKLKKLGI